MDDFRNSERTSSGKDIKRTDYPRKKANEEYGAEFAPSVRVKDEPLKESRMQDQPKYTSRDDKLDQGTATNAKPAGQMAGYIGVGLGVLSLFMWALLLGPIAAVLGFYAYNRGRRTAGAWAVALGIISTLSYFVLIPFSR